MWGGWDSCGSGSDSHGQYTWFITWTFSHPIYYSYRHKYYLSACSPSGGTVTGLVEDLQDNCYNGCTVNNLSPTASNEWVRTLQGTTTGATCTDSTANSGVNAKKMLACGTVGSSSYSTKTANPVDFAIGNKFFRDTDYRGSGSFPIVFTRTYNSLDLGWRFSYTQRIDSLSPQKVVVRRAGGQTFEYLLSGSQWQPDPDVVERLEWLPTANGGAGGWRYTLADHSQEFYDADGRLIAIRNPAKLEQTLAYSTDGRQLSVTSPEGDTLHIELDADGRLPARITDSTGRSTLYTFDGLQLHQVTHPDGTTQRYLYEQPERPWLITGIIDENGHRSHTVAYDAQGRAILSERADGAERVEISYNGDGTTTLTNALGKRTTFHFETIHGVKKIVRVEGEPTETCQGSAMDYKFDANGFLIEKTDAEGVTTRYTRDTRGLELSRTEAYGLPEARTVTTEWDSDQRQPLVVREGNRETSTTYDDQGRILTRTVTDTATSASRTTGYSYNGLGLIATIDGPREDVADLTTYDYDDQGRLAAVTNALGHRTVILERDNHGRPTRTRDPNGLETVLSYDLKGRLIERREGAETTVMAYDPVGNLKQVTTPGGETLHYAYDAANRLTGMADSEGNRITYTLDAMGNRTSEQVSDAGGHLARTQQKVYDELSRLLRSIGADGATTHYGYDRNDNLTSTFDPLWRLHARSYDALNRLVEQTGPTGGLTRYGYDALDRLTTVMDPNGNTTTYTYDALSNLLRQDSPDTGTTTFTHDAAGNVLSKTDAKGQLTRYQYDALNRLIGARHADGSVITYAYDTAENGIGRLGSIQDSSGSTAFRYDAHGRVTSRAQIITVNGTSVTRTTAYQYDNTGRPTGMTYPSGLQVAYGYTAGKISSVTINGQPVLTGITYQPFGPIAGWHWGNGTPHTRDYDLDGRLTRHSLGADQRTFSYDVLGNITALQDRLTDSAFDYDELNRLTAVNDPAFVLGWDYDANGNRLLQVAGLETTTYGIEPTSNRLISITEGDLTRTMAYDLNGNTVADGEHSYGYDARDRLVSVDNGQTGQYRYNALGQRVYKWAITANTATPDLNGDGRVTEADLHVLQEYIRRGNAPSHADLNGDGKVDGKDTPCIATLIGAEKSQGKGKGSKPTKHGCLPAAMPQERLFVYDEWRLLGEYGLNGSAVQETVWLGDLPIATVQNGEIYYVHPDHLGTPRVITAPGTGTEIWRWDSEPFGSSAANEDPDGDGNAFTYNLRFPGQYFDQETGLNYNLNRTYDPGTGRYVESDPIGLDGGFNTYAYAELNPVRYSDPLGLWVKRCARGLGDKDKPAKKPSGNPLRHDYISVSGQIVSFQAGDGASAMLWSQGRIDDNEYPDNPKCEMVCSDDKFDQYVLEAAREIGAPSYCVTAYPMTTPWIYGARNCQTWADDVLILAKEKYLEKEKCPQCFK